MQSALFSPLFAESSEGAIAVLMALSSVLGGAILWLANYLSGRRKERRAELKEDEKGIVDHQNQLIQRLSREIEDLRARADNQTLKLTRLIAHMSYLEGIMAAKGIKFRPYRDDETGEHLPIPSEAAQ